MPYGVLSPSQKQQLKHFVQGQRVVDLGAGDLKLANDLLRLGTTQVLAIDKEGMRTRSHRIALFNGRFDQVPDSFPLDLAFVAWPPNWKCGLERLVRLSKTVVYLGKNTDGTMCGTAELFQDLSRRNVLAYVPDPKNTLIVYGSEQVVRPPKGEELAGLRISTDLYSFAQAEAAVQESA